MPKVKSQERASDMRDYQGQRFDQRRKSAKVGFENEDQLQVLDDAATLEREACLSPGFTSKLMRAYTDSVRPRGAPLKSLFDRWTSAR